MNLDQIQFPTPEKFISDFSQNEIFIGFAALSILGIIMYVGRSFLRVLWTIFLRKFTVELTVKNADDIYDSVLNWLHINGFYEKTKRLRVGNKYESVNGNGETRMEFLFYPGDGNHLIWYNKKPIILSKSSSEDSKARQMPETIVFRTLGRSQKALISLVENAVRIDRDENHIKIFQWSYGWGLSCRKKKKAPDSLIMHPEVKDRLIRDVKWFLENPEWYEQRGVPYHRGYLLYGPPGTGKTSLVFLIASIFNKDIKSLNLNSIASDSDLENAFSSVGPDSILLIEDVDTHKVVEARTETLNSDIEDGPSTNKNDDNKTFISLSGILNALDGIASAEGRIVILTTNNPSKFDSALVRPGRIDMKLKVGLPERAERKQLFTKFFPEHKHLSEAYADRSESMSPADIQGELMVVRKPEELFHD